MTEEAPTVPDWEHDIREKLALGEGLTHEELQGALYIMCTLHSLMEQALETLRKSLESNKTLEAENALLRIMKNN